MHSRNNSLTALIILFTYSLSNTAAFNYLMIVHSVARAHYNIGFALAKGLTDAGHQVTLASPFPLEQPIKGITDLPVLVRAKERNGVNLHTMTNNTLIENFFNFHQFGVKLASILLAAPNMQTLMQSNKSFDAVICQIFLNEAHFGFAELFNATFIGLNTFGSSSWITDMVGTPLPTSHVPHAMLAYSDRMTLKQRLINFVFHIVERILLESYYLPKQEIIYKQYFPNNRKTFNEMRRNAALVLLNQHVSLSFPRPYSPNMIEVAGMHINSVRTPLPKDIETFIDSAKHGVILFSIGSHLRSKDFPKEKLEKILNTFRSLKQRILWKYEAANISNKPKNVYISAWLPQADILAHPNVLAFFTHGGLLSITESIYFAKPIIGMPIIGDQFMNIHLGEKHGYALAVNYKDFTSEQLKIAINRVINEEKFTKNAVEVSKRFRDQMVSPLERAIYWIEHVTRHKGASYLRSASLDLNFIQYHNLDVMFIVFGLIILINYGVLLLICFTLRKIFRQIFHRVRRKEKCN